MVSYAKVAYEFTDVLISGAKDDQVDVIHVLSRTSESAQQRRDVLADVRSSNIDKVPTRERGGLGAVVGSLGRAADHFSFLAADRNGWIGHAGH
jgi:hypothetical protein